MEKHPLKISLILENIFGRCRLQDLKNCRQVCHFWKNECSPHIRRISKATFGSCNENGTIKEFKKVMNSSKCQYLPMETFDFSGHSVLEVGDFFAFDDFSLSVKTLRLNFWKVEARPEFLSRFLLNYNLNNIQELELKNLPSSFHGETGERLFPSCQALPVLSSVKKLSVTNDCSYVITSELLQMCPNMTALKFGWCHNPGNQIKALESLDRNRHSKISKIKIKAVDFDSESTLKFLTLLMNSDFRLKILNLSRCTFKENGNSLGKLFYRVFQQQSQTLQKLALPAQYCDSTENLALNFPKMEFLNRISSPNYSILFSLPTFSYSFPNLKMLNLKKFQINNYQESLQEILLTSERNGNSTYNLHSLVLPANLNSTHDHFVNKLSRLFSITVLRVFYEEPEILESIWKAWPTIFSLHLVEENCTQTIHENTTIRYNGSYLGLDSYEVHQWNNSCHKSNILLQRCKASIADLKDLNTLKISSQHLTDITGYLGISMLKKLVNVELDCQHITSECMRHLQNTLPLFKCWTDE